MLGLLELVKHRMGRVSVALLAVGMLSLVAIGAFPFEEFLSPSPPPDANGIISLLAGVFDLTVSLAARKCFRVIGTAAIFEATGAMIEFAWSIIFGSDFCESNLRFSSLL